jgi:tetratricopeptide (TPR) repeat protein
MEVQMNLTRSAFARRAAIAILAAFALALPQLAMAQSNPLVGTWKLLPEKSTGARYQSMTLTIADPTVMNVEGVDAQGKPVKGSFAAITDGKPHPITGIAGYDSGSWTRYNDTNTTYSYLRGKSIVALGTRTLSSDGKTLTFSEKLYDSNGKQTGTSVMVFDNPDVKVASVVAKPAAVAAPRGPTADESAGEAAWQKGDADATIAAFTRALDKKEPGANPHYDYVMRGVAYAKKEQYEQASADFDAALMLKPDDVDARFRRGGTRYQLRQYPGVIEDMSAVVQADPMNATAYYMRGRSYYMIDQNMNSTDDAAKACALNKQFCMP